MQNKNRNIEIDLEAIARYGKTREDENFRFRTFLKGRNSDEIDKIVHRLNRDISNQIDCTSCGYCCLKLKPCMTDQDINRLSTWLNLSPDQIRDNFIENDEGEQYFNKLPCSFLNDKKCSIYEDRPEDCRSFPHLHKEGFNFRLLGVIQNYSICPIVFNVFEGLKKELNFS